MWRINVDIDKSDVELQTISGEVENTTATVFL